MCFSGLQYCSTFFLKRQKKSKSFLVFNFKTQIDEFRIKFGPLSTVLTWFVVLIKLRKTLKNLPRTVSNEIFWQLFLRFIHATAITSILTILLRVKFCHSTSAEISFNFLNLGLIDTHLMAQSTCLERSRDTFVDSKNLERLK